MKKTIYALVSLLAAGYTLPTLAQVPAEQQAPAATQPGTAAEMAARARYQQDMNRAAQFRLPPDFMTRMTNVMTQIRAANIQAPDSSNLTLDQTIAQTGAMPGVAAILRANGFTAHDFVLGLTCFGLTSSLMNRQGQSNGPALNSANVALIRSNPQQAQALGQALGAGQQQ